MLRVETGYVANSSGVGDNLDYGIYENIPSFWRNIEELQRLDWYLAWRVKSLENQYDIIWANSEKVGIPLSFFRMKKPLVVVTHHMESRWKAKMAKLAGVVQRWDAIGYTNPASREFLITYFGVPEDRLFQYFSARYLHYSPQTEPVVAGPILSLGIAKRDYRSLLAALDGLPDFDTIILVSSRYGDQLRSRFDMTIPEWVHFLGFVQEDKLIELYRAARFVVLPLQETTHFGAGISVILEAGALGKAVIATRNRGTAGIIKDGVTGILVPPYDVEAMREAIRYLWDHPEIAFQMGESARKFVEQNYNPERVNQGVEAMLQRLAQR